MDSGRRLPSHRIKEIEFGVYSSEEVKALSLVQVTNPSCIDMLGHAVVNGPHDPHMGTTERGGICTVCYQPSRTCPGHMGHIALPVPIFNPMFFRTVLTILRGSCFSCKSINCDPLKVPVFLRQMEALDRGSMAMAMDIPTYAQNFLANNSAAKSFQLNEKLEEILEELCAEVKGSENLPIDAQTQAKEERKRILSEFMHDSWKKNRSCLVCKDRNWRISSNPFQNKVMYKFGGGGKEKEEKPKGKRKSTFSAGKGKKQINKKISEEKNEEKNTSRDEAEKEGEGEVKESEEVEEEVKETDPRAVRFPPIDARNYLREVFSKNSGLLRRFFGLLDNKKEFPTDAFFIDSLLIPPTRFRPERILGDNRFAHVQTKNLERIILTCNNIRILRKLIQDGEDFKKVAGFIGVERIPGKTLDAKFHEATAILQTAVNSIADGDLDRLNPEFATGVKQVLEKKEGLFRMHMMGKRVNYSARSVISPDPYINLNEIGVPMVFAMRLTYPVFVSATNLDDLRKAVLNGPNIYPGAVMVEYEDGNTVNLSADNRNQRASVAKNLMTNMTNCPNMAKKVYRHLINGDIMLLNRQPTLHKTSIMAHKARVLPSEKTLRLHYANCKSYNADFDGDEMNAHLPQDEIARSEAYNIVNASYQYLVAKDGTPLSGLIQDHIVAGVHLTIRGKFFEKSDYEQLVYAAIGDIVKGSVQFLQPAIIKPRLLWSGKQIISTIVLNLVPKGLTPLSLQTASKVPVKSWYRSEGKKSRKIRVLLPLAEEMSMSESDVIFRRGELVCGVLDKAQYGPSSYGLVHACYELYGGDISALLLSGLARLFTLFLQLHGFSLGVEDILVSRRADAQRRAIMETVEACGDSIVVEAFSLDAAAVTSEMVRDVIEKAHRSADQTDMQVLDGMTKQKVDKFNSQITNACMPALYKMFPENHLQTMVLSGAKGALVNCIQMSCLLGQIELEGTRPPLMLSGRTLPSFAPYEATPRSGGFVMQRFGTGLRPQEYFFHCMAGREGLIDTAVKTSRSGYLQRCIIKHLEGVMVNYDLTVRDSDATVIQFLYGEDGLDIGRLPFYSEKQLPFLLTNSGEDVEKEIGQLKSMIGTPFAEAHQKKIASWRKKVAKGLGAQSAGKQLNKVLRDSNVTDQLGRGKSGGPGGPKFKDEMDKFNPKWVMDPEDSGTYIEQNAKQAKVVEPTTSLYRPDLHFGSMSERMQTVMEKYCKNPPLTSVRVSADTDTASSNIAKGSIVRGSVVKGFVDEGLVKDYVQFKYVKSLCQPGEAVGALAAQSIGEPSTQMTLNTFHFAGRGEMNVTLGIPRLREILMTASKTIKTPTMEVAVRQGMERQAEELRVRLNKVMFDEVMEYFDIRTRLEVQENDAVANVLELYVKLLPSAEIASKTCLTSAKILTFFERVLVTRLIETIKVTISIKKLVKSGKATKNLDGNKDDEAREVGGDEDGDEEAGAGAGRRGAQTVHDAAAGEAGEDAESVNSDGEDADPEAAKAQFAGDGDYAGDRDDTEIEHEFDLEQAAQQEGDELMEDKENSVMGDVEEGGDSPDMAFVGSGDRALGKGKSKHKMNALRREFVCGLDKWILDYEYDAKKSNWCKLRFAIPVSNSVLDPQSLIETELKRAVLYQAPNIKKSFLSREKDGRLMLRTEGVNFDYMMRFARVLEIEKLFSNDIQAVAMRFGIEAAAKTVIRECNAVFGAYGIDVNYRHLSLIADYMSVNGSIRAFNRMALTTNASPFQKMSFETSMNFYKDAVITGATDTIKSPSAQLVVGERISVGTGLFSLRQPALR